MSLLSWVPSAWKAAAWRAGAWLAGVSGLSRQIITVKTDLRTLVVLPVARMLSVLTDRRTDAVGPATPRWRQVVAELRTYTLHDARVDATRPDRRISTITADALREQSISPDSRGFSLSADLRTHTIPEESRTFGQIA